LEVSVTNLIEMRYNEPYKVDREGVDLLTLTFAKICFFYIFLYYLLFLFFFLHNIEFPIIMIVMSCFLYYL